MNKNVLIIDDDYNIRLMIKEILAEEENYITFEARNWDNAYKILKQENMDLVLLDICLPNINGMEILSILKKDFPSTEAIIVSGYGNVNLAVKAIKNGAFDFIEKPFSVDRILTGLDNAFKFKKLKEENTFLKVKITGQTNFIGKSKTFKNINDKILHAARSNAWVFITGASGTGKELVAKKIHFNSNRWNKPFIEVNCAAIPEELIESEMFGYEKGAFTGAINSKIGHFELSNRGTLFLDEIADISLATQAKILRVLEQKTIQRIGATKNIELDIRVIAATNKNILREIENKNFRKDLYYRLHVIPIHVPPLIERTEDIIPLMDYYLDFFAKQTKFNKKELTKEASDLLLRHTWEGNVRELRNAAERINILIEGRKVSTAHIEEHVIKQNERKENELSLYNYTTLKEAKEAFERQFINNKLRNNNMNISKTACNLKIERSNLYKKIKKYNI